MRATRPVSWLTPARKAFEEFPDAAREIVLDALSIAAEGGKAGIVKPMKGLGSGVFEVALPYRGNAYRVVYAVQLGDDLWVVHAFQKKSTHGIKTPKHEIDLIKDRIKRLKEILR
ncbi:MAG: type II toxin-antitoxin system RelE/ParE family toxin [Burkholderiales bacterium]|nr:type II toxin-antitoxin system RelE/ParE family toxin [Burkholderiales bacterium]